MERRRLRLNLRVVLLAGLGSLIVVAIALVAVLRSSSSLRITATVPSDCKGVLSYVVDLQGRDGIQNAPVTVYADGVFLERLRTDQNGRFASSTTFSPSWCGNSINVTAVYDGNLLHSGTTNATILVSTIPTQLDLTVPATIEQGDAATLTARLRTLDGTPVADMPVLFASPSQNASIADVILTGPDGSAQTNYTFAVLTPTTIQAIAPGNIRYARATSDTQTVLVQEDTCPDHTIVNRCSTQPGYYCTDRRALVFNCAKCGCAAGLVCDGNACITQEAKNAKLIANLQKEVVFVGYITPDGKSMVSGSGVVLAHTGTDTIILTNRHVINDAGDPSAVKILTLDKEAGTVRSIRIAPSGMDLAVLDVTGTYGTPATIDDTLQYQRGQDVVVLGSPGGLYGEILQGSVAKGIISNFETQQAYFDSSSYTYNAIQTDAAINHGNSGGGLFLLSNGDLIGINTLGGSSEQKQGINFAIDIKEFDQLPTYDDWPAFTPTPTCQDGTAYETCSAVNLGYSCVGGTLTPSCKTCGCPSSYPYCPNSGECFTCRNGTTPYQTSDGKGFCCPPGTQGTTSGHCV